MLENLELAAPCTVRWDDMTGDDRVRMCGLCHLNVHNISNMTEPEAQALLRTGEDVCVVFYRRADGTILTKNCPVGLKKIRDAARRGAKIAASFLSIVLSVSMAKASDSAKGFIRGHCVFNRKPQHVKGVVEPLPLLSDKPRNLDQMLPGRMLPRANPTVSAEEYLQKATLRYEECLSKYGERDERTLQALQNYAYNLASSNKDKDAAQQYEKLIAFYDEKTPTNVRIITYQRYRTLLYKLKRDLEVPAVDATLLMLNDKLEGETAPKNSPDEEEKD